MVILFDTLVWVGSNLLLGFAAWCLSRRVFQQDKLPMMIVHTILLCWACIVGVSTSLGIIGVLTPGHLMAGVSVIAMLTIAGLHTSLGDHVSDSEQAVVMFGKGAASSRHARDDKKSDSCPSQERAMRGSWYAAAWGLLLAFGAGRITASGLLQFPKDWDSLMYHIPLVDHWLQEGTLYTPTCPRWYFPGNNELLGLWFVGPFSGDFLIGLNNIPVVVLLAAAAFSLVELLQVSRFICHWATFAIVSVFPVIRQLVDNENDVAVAALFLACDKVSNFSHIYLRDGVQGPALGTAWKPPVSVGGTDSLARRKGILSP